MFVVIISCFVFFGLFRVFGGWVSRCDEPFPFDLFGFAPSHTMSFVFHFVCWFSMGRLILLRDQESVSSCNPV